MEKKTKNKKKIIIIFVEGKRVTMRNIKQKNHYKYTHAHTYMLEVNGAEGI